MHFTDTDTVKLALEPAQPIDSPRSGYPGFHPETVVLEKGHKRRENSEPLKCDMIYMQDVAVKMRDGITIYCNIYRPVTSEPVPVIVGWGNTGKQGMAEPPIGMPGGPGHGAAAPGPAGNPFLEQSEHTIPLSGYQVGGTQDPGYWVPLGYAIAAPDPRGVYASEGVAQYHSGQDAEDGYDFIEWLASQSWCNGKIGMSGNAWRGMTQWHIAAEQPPHLAAIAPWEGHADLFGQEFCRGGIPKTKAICGNKTFGKGMVEDVGTMIDTYPFRNEYWLDKRVHVENIQCAVYAVSSYSSGNHNGGTFAAFRECGSDQKWLRAHNTTGHEDFYNKDNLKDLQKFFDYYLKGIENDWPQTPRVRIPVYDHGGTDLVCRAEQEWPLARQVIVTRYLDAVSGKLSEQLPAQEASVAYEADSGCGYTVFTWKIEKETEITGYMNLILWLEAQGNDDMDVFANVIKLDKYGMPTHQWYVDSMGHKYFGADTRLRVSRRALDPARSTELEPYLALTGEQKLRPGEIVRAELGFWPTGMMFHKGETLMLYISTGKMIDGEDYHGADRLPTINKGMHMIHTGGQYDSRLMIPVIPTE